MANLLQIINRAMRLRNYSPRTIKLYSLVAKGIYQYYHKPLGILTTDEISQYLDDKLKQGCSSETIRVYIQALNYIMHTIYQRTDYIALPYPKRTLKLPVILSRQEIN